MYIIFPSIFMIFLSMTSINTCYENISTEPQPPPGADLLSNGTTSQFRRCRFDEGFIDPYIGRMKLNPDLYCDPKTFRFVPGFTCCSPEPPGILNPVFTLHQKSKPPQFIDWRNVNERNKFTYGKIYILVHGWSETLETSTWIMHAAKALVSRGFTTIVVDWRKGNKYYFQTCANVRTIGAVVGYSILTWKITSRTVLVGHSAGAQVVGEAGKFTKKFGRLIYECHGLDPAGPAFDGGSPDIRLSKGDCRVVQVVHSSSEDTPTSTGIFDRKFGTYHKSGNCDYWINCGHDQGPNCRDDGFDDAVNADGTNKKPIHDNSFCGHHIAPLVYISSIYNRCNFRAQPCLDCDQIKPNTTSCSSSFDLGYAKFPPNNYCDYEEDSNYNLVTSHLWPYC